MSNLSYCRFQNTVPDLEDCVEVLEDANGDLSSLSEAERKAAVRLIKLCRRVVDTCPEHVGRV